jgi:hypothetical protein
VKAEESGRQHGCGGDKDAVHGFPQVSMARKSRFVGG